MPQSREGATKTFVDPAYAEHAEPHRIAALADWKFIVTTQPEMPR